MDSSKIDIPRILDWAKSDLFSETAALGQLAIFESIVLGLRGYPQFSRGQTSKFETEIAQGLRNRSSLGLGTGERQYPDYVFSPSGDLRRKRWWCDFTKLSDGKRIWIECKTIFTRVLGKANDQPFGYDWTGTNARRYSPIVCINEVEADANRLMSLRSSDADYLGLFAIGFDHRDDLVSRHTEFLSLATKLKDSGWQVVETEWEDHNVQRAMMGFRERCWFWCRAVREEPTE